MTRITSYNILAGGYDFQRNGTRRVDQLVRIIRSTQPDVVGLVEAIHPKVTRKPNVAEEIAERLGMQMVPGGEPRSLYDYQPMLLTRLPIVYSKIHPRPEISGKSLIEVCVEEENGQHLTVFLTHLSASFNKGWAGSHIRQRELQNVIRLMAPLREQGKPHLLMGDFNTVSPGDPLKASFLLRYVVELDERNRNKTIIDGNPHLNAVVPPRLRFLKPVLRTIARSDALCTLFDAAAYYYVPRGCIRLLHEAGYIDCYRRSHPHEWGFTCPSAAPAGRIDYIFASPDLAERLEGCSEVTEGEGLRGSDASDHLAVSATFGLGVQPIAPSPELDNELDNATI